MTKVQKSARRRAPRVEVDVADPKAASPSVWLEHSPDVLMKLQELYSGDAGELSGAGIRFLGEGDSSILIAEFGQHALGFINGSSLLRFLKLAMGAAADEPDAPAVVAADLGEMYPNIEPRRPSGARLVFDGLHLGLWINEHCCGVQAGGLVQEFLRRAWLRATRDPQPGRKAGRGQVVSIESGRRKPTTAPELRTAG